MWRYFKKIAVCLLALLALPCLAVPAAARGTVDTGRQASLTVQFGQDGAGFAGAEFRLYRVADFSGEAFHLAGDFAGYPVSLEADESSKWRELAQTLDAYAARDGLKAMRTAKTDENALPLCRLCLSG